MSSTVPLASFEIQMTASNRAADMRPAFGALRTTEINVLFTTFSGTLSAARVAGALARVSGASVRLIDPRRVRVALRAPGAESETPIEERERARVVAAVGVPVGVVLVYTCGRAMDALRVALPERSLVVMGGRRSWLPTRLERLHRSIARLGHTVVFVNESEH